MGKQPSRLRTDAHENSRLLSLRLIDELFSSRNIPDEVKDEYMKLYNAATCEWFVGASVEYPSIATYGFGDGGLPELDAVKLQYFARDVNIEHPKYKGKDRGFRYNEHSFVFVPYVEME